MCVVQRSISGYVFCTFFLLLNPRGLAVVVRSVVKVTTSRFINAVLIEWLSAFYHLHSDTHESQSSLFVDPFCIIIFKVLTIFLLFRKNNVSMTLKMALMTLQLRLENIKTG